MSLEERQCQVIKKILNLQERKRKYEIYFKYEIPNSRL